MDPFLSLIAVSTGFGVATAALAAGAESSLPDRERKRREAIRRRSFVYRTLGGLVSLLAPLYRRIGTRMNARVATGLAVLGEDDWRPEEYLAARHLGLIPAITAGGLVAWAHSGGLAGLAMGLGMLLFAPVFIAKEVRDRAARRVREVRSRLPYTLDLMALVLEAGGGTLFDCLRMAADENAGHPLGEEYRRVVSAIEKGVSPTDALGEMSRRLGDQDVAEVNLAITTSESRGLPLGEALQVVGARIRTRQVQWMERAAEEAKVHITWPAMIVMIACLAIVVAPFLAGVMAGGAR